MISEKEFYKELGSVPPPPSDIYPAIGRRVRQGAYIKRSIMALAASLVLALGLTLFTMKQKTPQAALSPEVTEELQIVRDYLNGVGIEDEFNTYAVVSVDFTSQSQP